MAEKDFKSADVTEPVSPVDSKADIEGMKTTTSSDAGNVLDTIDPIAERKLVWKFDLRILPVLAIMYLFNSLDKVRAISSKTYLESDVLIIMRQSNLGNAKTAGLEKDLGLGDHGYNIILSVFFVPYVLTAPFLGILGKKYGPHIVLPCMMFSFGTFTLLVAAVQNFSGLIALRWFLGMAESAFFPVVIYYMTTFWRRGELARRLGLFYAAQSIASAFGGLLSFGVFQIDSGSLASWRYLFIIEGSCTILFAGVAIWLLPHSAADAYFLNEEEKHLATLRMQLDSSAVVNEKLNLRDAFKIFKHPTSWAILAIQVCLGVPLQSVTLFLPQIVSRLGYNRVKTNLYTVAPNVSGAVMLLILAFASDYTRWRFPFIVAGFLFTFTGFMIFVSIDVLNNLNVAYFSCFMMTWGTSAPSVLLDVWCQ